MLAKLLCKCLAYETEKSMTNQYITDYLLSLGNAETAKRSKSFFKTGKGEYGFGDIFLGIRVPVLRKAVKSFNKISLDTAEQLLHSKYHEIRLFALLLLVDRFNKATADEQKRIYKLYLNNTKYINNWDLVDSSAHYIVGAYLSDKNKDILYRLTQSDSLWERRVAVISTFYFIKNNDFKDATIIIEDLLDDQEDLIHKAAGWMLREIGKRDHAEEALFLECHYHRMPRTTLRYAVERFDEEERQMWLKRKVTVHTKKI